MRPSRSLSSGIPDRSCGLCHDAKFSVWIGDRLNLVSSLARKISGGSGSAKRSGVREQLLSRLVLELDVRWVFFPWRKLIPMQQGRLAQDVGSIPCRWCFRQLRFQLFCMCDKRLAFLAKASRIMLVRATTRSSHI